MPTESSDREERLLAIRKLLEKKSVRRQEAIVEGLRALGFEVGQSSVSRDFHELGVAKVKGRYVVPKAQEDQPRNQASSSALDAVVKASVTRFAPAGPNLVVIHSVIGAASAVGLAVDQSHWPEVVGTVAGDDTVFVATSGRRGQTHLLARLKRLIEGSEIHA